MRHTQSIWLSFAVALACANFACGQDQPPAAEPPAAGQDQEVTQTEMDPETEQDDGSTIEKASFWIGFSTILRLKNNGYEYDFDQVLAGMKAANADQDSGMTEEERGSVIRAYEEIHRVQQMEKQKQTAEKNRIEGESALEEFAAQEGATELEDGIMYLVLKEGDGAVPEAPDQVKLHYKGTYADGEEFDSSYERGEPIDKGVLQFVDGFSKALQHMKVGSKWKVIIRGDKAYGMRARPPMEANKTLIFEIELLEILDPK